MPLDAPSAAKLALGLANLFSAETAVTRNISFAVNLKDWFPPAVSASRGTQSRSNERPKSRHDCGARQMKHDTSRALYRYWLDCHGESGVRAAAIRAAELAAILPNVFLIDLDDAIEPRWRFRFCGASIATRYGRDLSGESFLELWSLGDATTFKRDLYAPAFRSTGMAVGLLAETVGGGFAAYEMLILPLAGDSGAAGAIGSMAHVGGHEETNRVRARIVGQSLRSIRFLPQVGRNAVRTGFVVNPALLAQPQNLRKRYGHLTVVTGGK